VCVYVSRGEIVKKLYFRQVDIRLTHDSIRAGAQVELTTCEVDMLFRLSKSEVSELVKALAEFAE
jgi:hypothetical protein